MCNKVGGINTVIASKAGYVKASVNKYCLIGPYIPQKVQYEFSEEPVPDEFKACFQYLETLGVKAHFGTWQIEAEPKVILIDFYKYADHKDEIKRFLWDHFQIDSLYSGWEFEEPMVLSWVTGMFLERFWQDHKDSKIVAHFHEWLSGFGLLYLRSKTGAVKTVFTTHATMLGRSICGAGEDLYGQLNNLNPDDAARRFGVMDKFTTERACAKNADIFTTVSEITGMEAEKILGRKPEVLLFNGLNIDKFPTLEETSVKHMACRSVIRDFLAYYFFPYYTFDLEHNITLFITSRYELRNKGIDLLAEALGLLNEQLKKDKSPRTVSVFFWTPMQNNGIKPLIRETKDLYYNIKELVDSNTHNIISKLLYNLISGKYNPEDTIFAADFLKNIKMNIRHFQRQGNPPMVTHQVFNEENEPLVRLLLDRGLDNKADDPVKVIVYPVYLDGNDGLLNLSLYDAITGCHFGLFPSYYEPWGYTPLETMALGVSALTSNLSGFGLFMEKKLMTQNLNSGIYILKMMNRKREDAIKDLFQMLYNYSKLEHAERVENKINAKNLSHLADWKTFVKNYLQAYDLALAR